MNSAVIYILYKYACTTFANWFVFFSWGVFLSSNDWMGPNCPVTTDLCHGISGVLVRLTTCNSSPKLSLITLSPPETTG